MRFCYKTKNKERKSTNNAKDKDEFAFAMQRKAVNNMWQSGVTMQKC